MGCFSGFFVVVGGCINFCRFLRLPLFCDGALTGETLHFMEFLLFLRIVHVIESYIVIDLLTDSITNLYMENRTWKN